MSYDPYIGIKFTNNSNAERQGQAGHGKKGCSAEKTKARVFSKTLFSRFFIFFQPFCLQLNPTPQFSKNSDNLQINSSFPLFGFREFCLLFFFLFFIGCFLCQLISCSLKRKFRDILVLDSFPV